MSLYLRVRDFRLVALVAAAVLALLAWPGSSMNAAPSPIGATVMMGVFLVAALPVVVGAGCARADERLESTAVRAIVFTDLVFAVGTCGLVAAAAGALHALGLADAGLAAARALLAYLGLLLLAVPFWGWRYASVLPALFLLAVAVFGRGEDFEHAARWAFIAAAGTDPFAWAMSLLVLVVGLTGYLLRSRRIDLSSAE